MSAVPLSETAAKRRIGDILLDHGFVTAEELAEATLEQERTKQPLGQILVGRGAITRLELASALAEQWSDPAASIMSATRSTPTPAPIPSAHDEAQYAARLQEAVADLARKVQSSTPLEGLDERVEELSRRIEGTLARTQHIEAAVATLAESLEGVTTGVEEAFYGLQTGTAELVQDLARMETTVGEIAAREAPGGDVDDLSARVEVITSQLDELRALPQLDDLQRTVRELEARSGSGAALLERLEQLELGLDESRAGDADTAARLEALTAQLSTSPAPDPRIDDALAQIAQLGAMLERTTSEVDALAAALGSRDEAAVDGRLDDLVQALEVLRGELADVRASSSAGDVSGERLDALELRLERMTGDRDGTIDGLSARIDSLEGSLAQRAVTPEMLASAVDAVRADRAPLDDIAARLEALEGRHPEEFVTPAALARALDDHQSSELARRLDGIEARLADGIVTPDALTRSIEWAMGEADAPAADERARELTDEVAALRAELASLAQRPVPMDDTDRLAGLEATIERLSEAANDDEGIDRRLDELEATRRGDRDALNVLAVTVDRLRHDLTSAGAAPQPDPEVLASVAALSDRLAALENAPAVEAVAPRDDATIVSELERFRLVLERIGLHLGEHDRAIADLSPNRGVQERLQELTALVHDLAASEQRGQAPPESVGTASPRAGEIDALLQRVEDAETASQADSEKLMNRLERMAASIDWRLQRLESDERGE